MLDSFFVRVAKDLYKILGIKKSASEDEVRAAYRKLARKYHPDVNPGDAAAESQFKEVAAAYEVLSDKDKRKAYDEFGEDSLKGGFDPDKAREYQNWQRSRTEGARPFAGDVPFDLGDVFGFGRRQRGPLRGADIHAVVDMDLRQAIDGGTVQLEVPGRKPVTVRVPPGADTGSIIRLAKKGAPGSQGGPPGDLMIETRVRPHKHIRRDGLNLHMTVPVSLAETYNGATIDVPTFHGPVKLTVPERSQNGARLRLRGKGVARGKKHGDLIVELTVRLPDQADEELAKVIEQSEGAYSQSVQHERERGIQL